MWEVQRLKERDAERAGELLARAFVDDPVSVYMLPNAEDRRRLLPWHFGGIALYGALFGEAYTTAEPLRGVALWLPPGETEMTPERLETAGMNRGPEVLGADTCRRFMRVMKLLHELHAADMPEEHWYLAGVGVEPALAGRGLGTALLRPVLERADARGDLCYLETSEAANRPFYEKLGFEVLRQGVEEVSRVPYWTFRRDPR